MRGERRAVHLRHLRREEHLLELGHDHAGPHQLAHHLPPHLLGATPFGDVLGGAPDRGDLVLLVGQHHAARRDVTHVTVVAADDLHVERERRAAHDRVADRLLHPAAVVGVLELEQPTVGGPGQRIPALHPADAVQLVGPLEPVGREVVPPAADPGQLLRNGEALVRVLDLAQERGALAHVADDEHHPVGIQP